MAGILFACTKDYKFLHSAHLCSEAIIRAVEIEVPGMGDFIEGRLKAPTNLPNLNQKPISNALSIKNHFMSYTDNGQRKYTKYGAAVMKVFSGRDEIEDKFFQKKGVTMLMDMLQLDIPYIFIPGHQQGTEFMKALNKTNEVDLFLQ